MLAEVAQRIREAQRLADEEAGVGPAASSGAAASPGGRQAGSWLKEMRKQCGLRQPNGLRPGSRDLESSQDLGQSSGTNSRVATTRTRSVSLSPTRLAEADAFVVQAHVAESADETPGSSSTRGMAEAPSAGSPPRCACRGRRPTSGRRPRRAARRATPWRTARPSSGPRRSRTPSRRRAPPRARARARPPPRPSERRARGTRRCSGRPRRRRRGHACRGSRRTADLQAAAEPGRADGRVWERPGPGCRRSRQSPRRLRRIGSNGPRSTAGRRVLPEFAKPAGHMLEGGLVRQSVGETMFDPLREGAVRPPELVGAGKFVRRELVVQVTPPRPALVGQDGAAAAACRARGGDICPAAWGARTFAPEAGASPAGRAKRPAGVIFSRPAFLAAPPRQQVFSAVSVASASVFAGAAPVIVLLHCAVAPRRESREGNRFGSGRRRQEPLGQTTALSAHLRPPLRSDGEAEACSDDPISNERRWHFRSLVA
ncbi:unnamed protein product [Prorocentrum cordatum]|uniref:Uncharacterized protein n=1 Tax=Prorocentrum cordatum TaxID=2364126 RepID=A0ABN9Y825_9DINO|nr:unnamed protein product [Polarella glacialis]